jgi:hypothetical protein
VLDLFMTAVIASAIAFVGCDVKALTVWRKGWRVGASLIGVGWLLVTGRIAIALFGDGQGHNLWPFEILVWSGLGLVGLGVLAAIRSLVSRERVYS